MAAATFTPFLKKYLKLEHFQAFFALKFGFSQQLWLSGWHFKWQNARLSESMILIL